MNEPIQEQPQSHLPPPPPMLPERTHSPGLAVLCALIPGIGAVYNRQYVKAMVHFSVFAGLCVIAEQVGIFGLAAFCFYVFTIIDAYRSAQSIELRLLRNPKFLEQQQSEANLPVWGALLVLMGVLFLLDNFEFIRFDFVVQFWPLIFVGLGLYLLFVYYSGMNEKRNSLATHVPGPSVPPRGEDEERF